MMKKNSLDKNMYLEELDEIDNKILSILEKDGRASYSEIG